MIAVCPRITAVLLTCPERRAILQNTLASLRATDWGAEPRVFENRDTHPDRRLRIQHGARALLERALAEGAELILYLEDDLVFNRHLRHNLTGWAPPGRGFARPAAVRFVVPVSRHAPPAVA